MSNAFKLDRARRLLLRAVALVTSGDEEGSSSADVDTPSCSRREANDVDTPSHSRREANDATVGASHSGPPMADLRADYARRNIRASYSGESRLLFESASQQRGGPMSSHGRGRESCPDYAALDAARNKEGQRLFGFNPGNSGRKRRKAVADSEAFPKKKLRATWSRDCICLNLHYQDWIPTVQEKISLSSSGLGLKRLTFQQDGDGQHIQKVISDAFPKLPLHGEFKLLRAGSGQSCKQLLVIGPPSGMTVPYLKDIVGQAKLYVRPNTDIEDEYESPEVSEEEPAEVTIAIYCYSGYSGLIAIRPSKLDFLFLIQQILCLYAGERAVIFHYSPVYTVKC